MHSYELFKTRIFYSKTKLKKNPVVEQQEIVI